MADLVKASQVLSFLGLEEGDEGTNQAQELATQVEALLESQCGRTHRPFKAAANARTERQDGTGRRELFLDYAIAALTSVKLGYNSAAPDETLVVNDQTKLVWQVGKARLVRVDGGTFGWSGSLGALPGSLAGYVEVVYDAQADLPEDAALAILRVVAAVFGQRGSEDAKSESVGGFRADLAAVAAEDPLWQAAVSRYREVHL